MIIFMLLGILSGALSVFLFIFRVLGAGDIKLLMVTGMVLGHRHLLLGYPLILIYAGILAFVTLVLSKLKREKKVMHFIPMAPVILLAILSEMVTF